ncbi:GNAT family acetyltransferase [Streptococcus pneumoniae]|nr:GNAT family acetyltransferase [Streptococcus pneumoniae]VLL06809.1 GNAT family acetyltransferase [Streptococcus pneumoniae]
MITIKKQEIVKLEDVLHLYQAVGWTNYTHQTEMLEQALSHSLVIYLALDGDAVVGLIRLVGDGFSSVFVQDLIVLSSYQRQGIGSSLMKQALGNFKEVYQVQLATEQTEKNVGFNRSMGFEILSTYNWIGMTWMNRKK